MHAAMRSVVRHPALLWLVPGHAHTVTTSPPFAMSPSRVTPEGGQHTEEVLLSLGMAWEQLAALKESGAIS
jgi:crotonobetainyl-CoA:carnitine CoA-transferase CaiB-like acyl-CoA transferase